MIGGILNGIHHAAIELAKGIGRRLRQEVCLHVISYTVSDDFTIHLTLLVHVNCSVPAALANVQTWSPLLLLQVVDPSPSASRRQMLSPLAGMTIASDA
jgi:hypothetical protein